MIALPTGLQQKFLLYVIEHILTQYPPEQIAAFLKTLAQQLLVKGGAQLVALAARVNEAAKETENKVDDRFAALLQDVVKALVPKAA